MLVSEFVRAPHILIQMITFILDCKIAILETSDKASFKVQRLTLHVK
jgi:hypothetical protein